MRGKSSNRQPRPRRLGWASWFILAISVVGCSSNPPPPPVDASAEQLHWIFRAYKQTELQSKQPPKSADEIKAALQEAGGSASDLVSPNDKQPYVIIWGTRTVLGPDSLPKTGSATAFPILAYEASGINGKRFTVDTRGQVLPLTDEEFRRATFPAGHKPK